VRVATWNLEWAKPGSRRHQRCLEQLESVDADVVVTTEHSLTDWEAYPHRVDAGTDWGYPIVDGRRKVIAWSRAPVTAPVTAWSNEIDGHRLTDHSGVAVDLSFVD